MLPVNSNSTMASNARNLNQPFSNTITMEKKLSPGLIKDDSPGVSVVNNRINDHMPHTVSSVPMDSYAQSSSLDRQFLGSQTVSATLGEMGSIGYDKFSEPLQNTGGLTGQFEEKIRSIFELRASSSTQQSRVGATRDALLAYENNLGSAVDKLRDILPAQISREKTVFQKANQQPGSTIRLLA